MITALSNRVGDAAILGGIGAIIGARFNFTLPVGFPMPELGL